MNIILYDLGTTDYLKTLNLQRTLQQEVIEKQDNMGYMIFTEHLPVITMGLRAKEEEIIEKGKIPVVEVERGGAVTLHSPGQIIGYFILPLKNIAGGLPFLVNSLEEMMISVLRGFNIQGSKKPKHPGVWVGENKIGNIGISIKQWVTMHGFSFNIKNDLNMFKYIIPCGLSRQNITSLQNELTYELPLEEIHRIKNDLLKSLEESLKVKVEKKSFL